MQVGEDSGALKPLAQGDSGRPGAVSYSPRDSCCITGDTAQGWHTALTGSREGQEQPSKVCTALPGGAVPTPPDLGAEEQGEGSLRATTQTAPGGLQQKRRRQNPTTSSTLERQTEGFHHQHCAPWR